jgi:hypothetical protein
MERSSKYDGVPTIDHSIRSGKGGKYGGLRSTSKFFLNENESDDDRLSNITEIVQEEDESQF